VRQRRFKCGLKAGRHDANASAIDRGTGVAAIMRKVNWRPASRTCTGPRPAGYPLHCNGGRLALPMPIAPSWALWPIAMSAPLLPFCSGTRPKELWPSTDCAGGAKRNSPGSGMSTWNSAKQSRSGFSAVEVTAEQEVSRGVFFPQSELAPKASWPTGSLLARPESIRWRRTAFDKHRRQQPRNAENQPSPMGCPFVIVILSAAKDLVSKHGLRDPSLRSG